MTSSSEEALDAFLQYALFMPLAGALLALLMCTPSGYTWSPLHPGKKHLPVSLALALLVVACATATIYVAVSCGALSAVVVSYICLLGLGYTALQKD